MNIHTSRGELILTERAALICLKISRRTPFFREGASVDDRQKLLENGVELMVTGIYVLNAIFYVCYRILYEGLRTCTVIIIFMAAAMV